MLSILIPIYNFDVRTLARALQEQALSLPIPTEILCFDDGSDERWKAVNRELATLPAVRYQENPHNLGRSGIRNALADAARGSHLLFLDCDSEVPDGACLQRYAALLGSGQLLYGGRLYHSKPPADPSLFLHWKYGRNREQMPPHKRQAKPYHHFMTNNFVIPAAVFQAIRFDERLRQYGHEDTLFGLELRRRKVPIHHLDNPLIHIGLEPAPAFLEKTKKAVQNLAFLYRSGAGVETRLTAFYERLAEKRLAGPARQSLRLLRPLLLLNLQSAHPSLFALDLYKLGLLLEAQRLQGGD